MIKTYHRPKSIAEALKLLTRPDTLPLGGGTLLSQATGYASDLPMPASMEVVDLQALGLNVIQKNGNSLSIGATATLQQLVENKHTQDELKSALKQDAPLNIRNMATVAGTIVAADGRSTFTAALLALDARITVVTGDQDSKTNLGDFLPVRPGSLKGSLITSLEIPLNAKLAFEKVARTPADKPIVCAALAIWPSGRTRLALGGYGEVPLLAMDGTEADGLATAARNAFLEAFDEWASAEYRMDVAETLAKRCLAAIG